VKHSARNPRPKSFGLLYTYIFMFRNFLTQSTQNKRITKKAESVRSSARFVSETTE